MFFGERATEEDGWECRTDGAEKEVINCEMARGGGNDSGSRRQRREKWMAPRRAEKRKLRERWKVGRGRAHGEKREKEEEQGCNFSGNYACLPGGNVSEGPGPVSRAVIIIWESHSTAAGRSSRINRVVVFYRVPSPRINEAAAAQVTSSHILASFQSTPEGQCCRRRNKGPVAVEPHQPSYTNVHGPYSVFNQSVNSPRDENSPSFFSFLFFCRRFSHFTE